MNVNIWKAMYYLFLATTLIGANFAQTTTVPPAGITAVSSVFCALVSTVRSIIALFAVVLFLIGGILYAIAHFLPTTGQLKGSLQGWALGMILGGIIGVILVIIAQPIVNLVAGFGKGIASVSC